MTRKELMNPFDSDDEIEDAETVSETATSNMNLVSPPTPLADQFIAPSQTISDTNTTPKYRVMPNLMPQADSQKDCPIPLQASTISSSQANSVCLLYSLSPSLHGANLCEMGDFNRV